MRRVFDLMNDMAEADSDVQTLLVVSIFEVIADDDQCLKVAEEYLSARAALLLRSIRGIKV